MPEAESSDVVAGEAHFSDDIAGGRFRRTVPLVTLTARIAAEAATARVRGNLTDSAREEFHARTAERYAETLGRSKGALMKAGQMLSFVAADRVVPSEFRSVYRTALARLYNDAPPMSPELVRKVLERELGRRALSAFAEFDWEPLASASIGQVHRAQLHDGRMVAVKVQYPGVAEAIRSDLKNAELLASLISLISGFSPRRLRADVRGAAREMTASILEELDYGREATNQAEFAWCYRGHPFIHVPEVIFDLCTSRVLTQELCTGWSWSEALTAEQALRDRWGEALWRFIYGSYVRFGLLNLDPNPGNFLFHEDGSVSFLDFGSSKHYEREQTQLAHAIVSACVRGEVLTTWRLCVEAGFWRASDPVSQQEVFAYWREPFRYLRDEQPFSFTPDYVERWIECRCAPTGPSANAISHLTMPAEAVVWPRLEVGLASMLGDLLASNHWRSIYAEYSEGASPLTSMGKLDRAYFADR
jgi:predicted unusual protein kinase regulating ubiquinone biosynthesis (AarF/ABC1/UbiB family)